MKNRAVTTEQKEEILKRLLEVWKKYPQLRFGQLIENVILGTNILYNIEDYDLVIELEKFYN